MLSGEWVFRSDNDTMNQQYSKFTGQMGNLCQFPHTLHLRLNHAGFFLLLFQFRFQNIDSRFCVFYIFQKSLVHFRKLDGINQTRHLIQIQFLHSFAPPVYFAFQPFQLVTLCMLSLLDWVILFWKGNFFRVKIICHIRPDTFQHSILQCVHICTGLVATHFRCALVHPAANIASLSPIRLWLTASLFHVAATASANHFFRQRMNRSFSTTPSTFFQHHLNCFKRPPVNDGFMGVFYNNPLRLRKPNRLFGLITHLFMPPLHHISDIKLIVQHLVYRGATPKVCIGIFRCNMVMDAMLLFISSWAWNFLIIQNPRNLMRTDSTKSHRENPPYHFGSFRIDDKFSFCIRVFAIPIPRKRADEGRLDGDTAVVTVMSNLGFIKYMESQGINTEKTAVGDRYVLENMRENGFAIGGEQSGHVILLHHATTGDGELTAGKLLKLLAESGKKMSELNGIYAQYPQVLVNVTANAAQKKAYKEDEVLAGFIENEQQKLMGMGRVLVRVSGTEPKIRVMVEGQDLDAIHRCADRSVDKINKRSLGQ